MKSTSHKNNYVKSKNIDKKDFKSKFKKLMANEEENIEQFETSGTKMKMNSMIRDKLADRKLNESSDSYGYKDALALDSNHKVTNLNISSDISNQSKNDIFSIIDSPDK